MKKIFVDSARLGKAPAFNLVAPSAREATDRMYRNLGFTPAAPAPALR